MKNVVLEIYKDGAVVIKELPPGVVLVIEREKDSGSICSDRNEFVIDVDGQERTVAMWTGVVAKDGDILCREIYTVQEDG